MCVCVCVCVCDCVWQLLGMCALSPGGLHNVTASVCDLPPSKKRKEKNPSSLSSASVCLSQGDFTSGHEGEDRTDCGGEEREKEGERGGEVGAP